MCGICGKLHFDRHHMVDLQDVKKMSDSIIHRGPDDSGFHDAGNVVLGFRRLSIIDLNTGHQPMANEDRTIWLIFNGEIYNHLELRKELEAKGHQFRTRTDTEVIVHLYEEYGNDCVKHLRGMFAFVIWDNRRRVLFVGRDRFGIKPFFYYLDKQRFVFCSEIKGILTDGTIDRDLSIQALDNYLTYGYTPAEQTIYENIKKLKAAHFMEIRETGDVLISRYWDIHYDPDYSKSEEEWCELIEDKLSESVRMRLMSDVPLGAFLSGGIDSSSVVALMAQHSDKPIKTFSIGFKEAEYSELEYARELSKAYGTEHYEQIVEPESVGLLPKLVAAYDEPFADSSAIPTYYLSKFAREHVTVALSGDGGDELFVGYRSYAKMNNIHNYNFNSDAFNKFFWGNIHRAIPAGMKGKGITYYLSKPKETVSAYTSIWPQTERSSLYRPGIWQQMNGTTAEEFRESYLLNSSSQDRLFRMQETDMQNYMVDDILTKVDRASMLHSLEVRVPILDHEFAELSFRIPSNLKLKDGIKKYILRQAMSRHLPNKVLSHRKQGFEAPLRIWFKKDLKDYVNDRLIQRQGPLYEFLNPDFVVKTVQRHQNGMRDFNQKLWALLFLDEWLRSKDEGSFSN